MVATAAAVAAAALEIAVDLDAGEERAVWQFRHWESLLILQERPVWHRLRRTYGLVLVVMSCLVVLVTWTHHGRWLQREAP
jgi:hypothetical protein